jgi:hypothetical protein
VTYALYAYPLFPLLWLPIQSVMWRIEDRRFNRFVDRWAQAALAGTDLSVLDGCPDLSRLGKR